MFALPPLAFVKNNESSAIIVLHVGRSLCGHDGIIHGGLLATVLDESLGRNVSRRTPFASDQAGLTILSLVLWKPLQALLNIPSKIGVTATLNVQYKKPTKADQVSQSQSSKRLCILLTRFGGRQFIVVRTELDSVAGRKVNVSGSIESLDGEILATAQYV